MNVANDILTHQSTSENYGKNAVQHTAFFMPWRMETEYQAGDRVTYYGTLYKCLQAHTSQSDWTPDAAPSLWAEITLAG